MVDERDKYCKDCGAALTQSIEGVHKWKAAPTRLRKNEIRVRTRKRYWLVYIPFVAIFTLGIGLVFFPFLWLLDKSMAKAAYWRQQAGFPPSWYDGMSMWEFELVKPRRRGKGKSPS